MKYSPNFILLTQAKRYLNEDDKNLLNKHLSKYNPSSKRAFFKAFIKNFNIDLFKSKPLIWQDIWLYNYINFEANIKLKPSGLIAKYEKEAFILDDNEFYLKINELNNKKP